MNTEAMAEQATKRVSQFIARSAGQHSRAIREHADEWTIESMENAAACHQQDMDKLALLYELGCKYEISMEDSRKLCDVAGIDFAQLMRSTRV